MASSLAVGETSISELEGNGIEVNLKEKPATHRTVFKKDSKSRHGHGSSSYTRGSVLKPSEPEQTFGTKITFEHSKSKVVSSTHKQPSRNESAKKPVMIAVSPKEAELKDRSAAFPKVPSVRSQTDSSRQTRSYGKVSTNGSKLTRTKSCPQAILSTSSQQRPFSQNNANKSTAATDKQIQKVEAGKILKKSQTLQSIKCGHLQNDKSRWHKVNKDTISIYTNATNKSNRPPSSSIRPKQVNLFPLKNYIHVVGSFVHPD